jgi:hypothetical protein
LVGSKIETIWQCPACGWRPDDDTDKADAALALDAGRETAELLREAIQACKFGTGTESGPDFLSRVAAVVASIGGPVTAAELRAKAAAELAVLAKAKALGWLEEGK